MKLEIQHFFDPRTSTLTYVVFDEESKIGVVVDSVLDYDPKNARTPDSTLKPVCQFIEERKLTIPCTLELSARRPRASISQHHRITAHAKQAAHAGNHQRAVHQIPRSTRRPTRSTRFDACRSTG